MAKKMPLYTKKKLNAYRKAKEEQRLAERKQEEQVNKVTRSRRVDDMLEGCREW